MTWEQLCKVGCELPEVEEGIWWRTPALQVRGKSFVRLKEDGATVVFLLESVDEQEFLIQAMPALYFITDHYKGYPAVLARLSKLRVDEGRRRLEAAWRLKAPKTLVRRFEEARAAPVRDAARAPRKAASGARGGKKAPRSKAVRSRG
ncbi:hypothetical protein HPC49_17015 [Pyxidicoccus fallax]|uniref:MmcQ/YjbR family DNA-binding protein n=1 Tax=Pyxidicoccus fallax TaxID=394095 RepID=A0A848LFE1_9BACT|nr:MmcQ/YjbR family DNA-binding protein [Pyxidicoccus fallax]NMO14278.1 hypothetical protein [Pyxidicoccus fallax]NPC79917.1 hypothetical protein [Pyxidicoccus fallax]